MLADLYTAPTTEGVVAERTVSTLEVGVVTALTYGSTWKMSDQNSLTHGKNAKPGNDGAKESTNNFALERSRGTMW